MSLLVPGKVLERVGMSAYCRAIGMRKRYVAPTRFPRLLSRAHAETRGRPGMRLAHKSLE